jgi:hypothetical protein
VNDPSAPNVADGAALVAAVTPPLDPDVDPAAPAASGGTPAWQRDGVAISARVRALLATVRPVIVRVRSFWDHAVRRVALGAGRAVEVDASGSYRLREAC